MRTLSSLFILFPFLFSCSGNFEVVTFENKNIKLSIVGANSSVSGQPILLHETKNSNYTYHFTLSQPLPVNTSVKLFKAFNGIPVSRVSYSGATPTSYGYELIIPRGTTSTDFTVEFKARPGNTGVLMDMFQIKIEGNIEHSEFKELKVIYFDSENALSNPVMGNRHTGYITYMANRVLGRAPQLNLQSLEKARFGSSIDANHRMMIVGAAQYGLNVGSVTIFKFDPIIEKYSFCNFIESPEQNVPGLFGDAVAIQNNSFRRIQSQPLPPFSGDKVVAVGAPVANTGKGKVYLYSESDLLNCFDPSIQPIQTLEPPSGKGGYRSRFGAQLKFFNYSSSTASLAIGMPGCGFVEMKLCYQEYNANGIEWQTGSVYVFYRYFRKEL